MNMLLAVSLFHHVNHRDEPINVNGAQSAHIRVTLHTFHNNFMCEEGSEVGDMLLMDCW